MASIPTSEERRRLAVAYAADVQALLAPAATREVGVAAKPRKRPATALRKSKAFQAAAAATLTGSADPAERAAAEVQLLAGAALDLMVAGQLDGAAPAGVRGLAGRTADLAVLQEMAAFPEAYLTGGVATRGLRAVTDAREQLTGAVRAALVGIRDDVVATGGHVVEGLLLMDAALLREALATVGTDLATRIGVDLKGLSKRAVEFVIAANDKIIALLGISALDEARKQLGVWLGELKAGTLFPRLAEKVLQTGAVQTEVDGWVASFAGDEAVLAMAADEIGKLEGRFSAKMAVADKIISALAVAKLFPPLMTPAGRLGMAAAYLGLLAYTIGSGYDHVDSDKIKLLDWAEGVRGVAKRLLVALPPA
ncbi:MAG: hypothetical protein NT169_18555 [Chloroflexi bacterium]|nr:hypothetical protein [Chloroflexota bacterium]